MPHVASETITHAFNHKPPHPGRPPQASDRAQATPFESLLDDSAPSTPDRPPAADDNASRTDRSHGPSGMPAPTTARRQNPTTTPRRIPRLKFQIGLQGRSQVRYQAGRKSDTQSADADADVKNRHIDATDKPDDDCKTTDDGKAAADTMTTEQAANIDGSNPVSDDKPVVRPSRCRCRCRSCGHSHSRTPNRSRSGHHSDDHDDRCDHHRPHQRRTGARACAGAHG